MACNNSGICAHVYKSTITSQLGVFGVPLSGFSEYLLLIAILLLGISLISLYIKMRSFLHKPFLLRCAATTMIISSHFREYCYYLIYVLNLNLLMITAAIWNARMNKFYGYSRFKK
jgi:hypothetical protein